MPRQRTMIPRVCEQCGATFLAHPSLVKRGGAKYCSVGCYATHKRKHNYPYICEYCGTPFSPRRPGSGQRFCTFRCARRPLVVPLIEQFWPKVDTSGECWLWTAARDKGGYGLLTVNGTMMKAHRIAWELANGPIPDGLWVLHHCDTPACCRVSHLYLGTHSQNVRDMVDRGRAASGDRNASRAHPERLARGERNGMYTHPEQRRRGELNGEAKLTWEKVREIRARHAAGGISYVTLAQEYGVTPPAIGYIIRGKNWIEPEVPKP